MLAASRGRRNLHDFAKGEIEALALITMRRVDITASFRSAQVVQDTVGSCSIERCPECWQGQEDPLDCGWCGDQCSRFDECPLNKNFSLHRCPKPVYHVHPRNGSIYGGTPITIEGDNLGGPDHEPYSSITILVGERICHVVQRSSKRQVKNSTHLECSREPVARDLEDQEKEVILMIDGLVVPSHSKNNLRHRFTFKPDPVVTDTAPKSRNFTVYVKGAHLDSVSKPIIVSRVTFPGQENEYLTKVCQPRRNGTEMICPGTPLKEFSVARNRELEAVDSDIEAQISFHMDGLHLPLDQNGDRGHFKLVYQPPPVFYSFPGVQSVDPSDPSVKITVKYDGHNYPIGDVILLSDSSSLYAGIVAVAVFLLVAAFAVGVFFLFRRRRRIKATSQSIPVVTYHNRRRLTLSTRRSEDNSEIPY
ncbi:hypothetical protein V5799_009638 [Amblyomma americanum]|uniref:IPT/TIG domain-containing protein n=1 Tax=Amblyomma americanum TaxID=6943 RepID=A0AAQ4FB43_AMBAM